MVIKHRHACEALASFFHIGIDSGTADSTAARAAMSPRIAADRPLIPSLACSAFAMKVGLSARANKSQSLLAAALGDVEVQYIWRFLRAQKIDLAGRKSWCCWAFGAPP